MQRSKNRRYILPLLTLLCSCSWSFATKPDTGYNVNEGPPQCRNTKWLAYTEWALGAASVALSLFRDNPLLPVTIPRVISPHFGVEDTLGMVAGSLLYVSGRAGIDKSEPCARTNEDYNDYIRVRNTMPAEGLHNGPCRASGECDLGLICKQSFIRIRSNKIVSLGRCLPGPEEGALDGPCFSAGTCLPGYWCDAEVNRCFETSELSP